MFLALKKFKTYLRTKHMADRERNYRVIVVQPGPNNEVVESRGFQLPTSVLEVSETVKNKGFCGALRFKQQDDAPLEEAMQPFPSLSTPDVTQNKPVSEPARTPANRPSALMREKKPERVQALTKEQQDAKLAEAKALYEMLGL